MRPFPAFFECVCVSVSGLTRIFAAEPNFIVHFLVLLFTYSFIQLCLLLQSWAAAQYCLFVLCCWTVPKKEMESRTSSERYFTPPPSFEWTARQCLCLPNILVLFYSFFFSLKRKREREIFKLQSKVSLVPSPPIVCKWLLMLLMQR